MSQRTQLSERLRCRIGFPSKLKNYRLEKDLSRRQLSEEIGCCSSLIAQWELGMYFPSVEKLIRLTEALGCSLDELVFK